MSPDMPVERYRITPQGVERIQQERL